MTRAALLAVLALTLAGAAPPDARQDARAHAIFRQIRCLVCQNESIDDSDAPLAADLRARVRAQVLAGRTDRDITRDLVDRYGEFVLLKPRLSAGNAALWLTPFAIVLAGVGVFAWRARRPGETRGPVLSDAERARIETLAAEVTVRPRSRPTDTTATL